MEAATVKQVAIAALRRPILTIDDSVGIEAELHALTEHAGGDLLQALYAAEDAVSLVAPGVDDGSPLTPLGQWELRRADLETVILSA